MKRDQRPGLSARLQRLTRDVVESETAWQDALTAIRIAVMMGHRIGGIHLRARAGPVRDIWLERFQATLGEAPVIRFSPDVDEGRLLGDLDLARTLAEGRPVLSDGVLTRADGGAVVLAMAERAEPTLCGILAAAMDTGQVRSARMAGADAAPARFILVALDEGAEPDERMPVALDDRLALRVDLSAVSWRMAEGELRVPDPVAADPAAIAISDAMLTAFATAAMQAGWVSMRAPLWLSLVARAVAAVEGAGEVAPTHAATAIRLVFGPLAMPEATEEDAPQDTQDDTPPPPPPPDQGEREESDDPIELDPETLQDMLIAAKAIRKMHLPVLLPAQTAAGGGAGSGKAGAKKTKARRGRPIGHTPHSPYPGARPDVLATLRAAAPWQKLRAREGEAREAKGLHIRKSDFRYRRLRDRTETTVIFAVDASGSTALARLGEAKGAVELLLAECYTRRDSVAVIAFRGTEADILLEPTRSLVRAKRSLTRLPGGGPTPLASAMAKALEMSDRVMREGNTPILVMMTDGNGNIALDGTANRAQSREDVATLSRHLAAQGMRSVMIDISARPRESARSFAAGLQADYVALPRADAASVSSLVSTYMQER